MSKCRIHQISPDSTTLETGTLIETSNSLKQRRKTRFFTQQVMNFWNMSLPCLLPCLSWDRSNAAYLLIFPKPQLSSFPKVRKLAQPRKEIYHLQREIWKAESLQELNKIVKNGYNNISLLFWMQRKGPKNNNKP